MRGALGLLLLALAAGPALSAAPEVSPRPEARVVVMPEAQPMRPEARPAAQVEALIAEELAGRFERLAPTAEAARLARERAFAAASRQAVPRALRPLMRSGGLVEKAMARQRDRRGGALCGDPALQGDYVGYVPGRIRGCGIEDAVELRSVSGVALSQRALVHCSTAKALKRWVDRVAKPSVGRVGGGIAELKVAAHYSCRTRNNQPGAKISEHGKGRAIDISAINLRDGSQLSVLGGYRTDYQGPILRRMYKGACGIFGTTLGPDSDRYHQDHFHFDTARHRGGAYCGP
ncbi:extensin family protein [Roseivivax sp. GX 12232]|uniref:extensin-like domain-containing protein n=1 Tax=Roseivivax sp. GX 12232 TaxID=2900547 RepID=UPI001E526B75|nr:extensin family protein [Roseivivax sp. GX 12232]